MAANTAPIFPATPKTAVAQASTANTNRDGSGTIATLLTAGSEGSFIENIRITAVGTTMAGMVRFFISKDGGTTWRLWYEETIAAVTPSSTTPAHSEDVSFFQNKPLAAGDKIGVSTHNAETFNIIANYGDY